MPIAHRVETTVSALALVLAGKAARSCRPARRSEPPGVVFRHFRDVEATMDIAACWRSDWDSPLIGPFLACTRAALRDAGAGSAPARP